MDLGSISVFNLASSRAKHLAARQQVISENIANADTPGYKAQDVESFADYLGSARNSGLAQTDPRHLGGSSGAGGVDIKEFEGAWETTPDGNSVSVEQQVINAGETAGQYKLATTLYKKSYDLLSMASSGGR